MDLTPLVAAILESASDDWVGLWELPYLARSVGGAASKEQERQMSLEAIRVLLEDHGAQVGDVTIAQGFVGWPLDSDAVVERIDREWRELKRHPQMGEVGWIRTP
jgi:hypothetical protein